VPGNVPKVADVTVVEKAPGIYTVTVSDGTGTSSHTVRIPVGLPDALGCAHVDQVELVRSSFAFLLERESASSILRNFSLEQIGDYFPEYRDTIRRSLAARAPGGETGP
jgi:hypothetical protein